MRKRKAAGIGGAGREGGQGARRGAPRARWGFACGRRPPPRWTGLSRWGRPPPAGWLLPHPAAQPPGRSSGCGRRRWHTRRDFSPLPAHRLPAPPHHGVDSGMTPSLVLAPHHWSRHLPSSSLHSPHAACPAAPSHRCFFRRDLRVPKQPQGPPVPGLAATGVAASPTCVAAAAPMAAAAGGGGGPSAPMPGGGSGGATCDAVPVPRGRGGRRGRHGGRRRRRSRGFPVPCVDNLGASTREVIWSAG